MGNGPNTEPCSLADCPGLNPDGTCPNGYGETCESVFPEPTNMADDPLLKSDGRTRTEQGVPRSDRVSVA